MKIKDNHYNIYKIENLKTYRPKAKLNKFESFNVNLTKEFNSTKINIQNNSKSILINTNSVNKI